MYKQRLLLRFLAIFLLSATLFAVEEQQSIYIYPIQKDSQSKLVYTSYLLASIQKIYNLEIRAKGAQLVWNFDWNQDYVGAGSSYQADKKEFNVMLFGGHVRATSSNFEVVAATLCHEIGHFLGGPPHQIFFAGTEDWSSAEGQSDWFAASQCLPKVFDDFILNHPEFLTFHNEEVTAELCKDVKEKRKCQWILGAAETLAHFFDKIYEHETSAPSLLKTERQVVIETLHTKYPSVQCRLDTMKEGAFCAERICERPACWYKKEWDFGLGCLPNCPVPQ